MWGTFGGHDLEELLGQLLGHTKFMATLSAHMDVCPQDSLATNGA